MQETFDGFVARVRQDVEEGLSEILQEPSAPARLMEALRYASLGAGKRIRPLLVVACGEAAAPSPLPPGGRVRRNLVSAACAVEMVHTFSLIHDDLPCLDDDDLRRGRPTLHVRFDEATAVLAGDALLNLAYQVMAERTGERALAAIVTLSRAVGLSGMISGQMIDLESEGVAVDPDTLHRIHSLKTGALITASCEIGGIVAGAEAGAHDRLREFGEHLGLAFQIIDDILDVEGSAETLGKSPGKDAKVSKATFPAMWGVEESRRRAEDSVGKARMAARELGDRGASMIGIAEAVLTRRR